MGININQTDFPEPARHPVSLRQITGQSFDVVGLAHELGECLDRRYSDLTAEGRRLVETHCPIPPEIL